MRDRVGGNSETAARLFLRMKARSAIPLYGDTRVRTGIWVVLFADRLVTVRRQGFGVSGDRFAMANKIIG